MPTIRQRIGSFFFRLAFGPEIAQQIQLAISAPINDDNTGWTSRSSTSHDRDAADLQQLYLDTLTAWRKNPLAWRIIQITTDYVVGEKITISSRDPKMQEFIDLFWDHPKNMINNRLETMCDELSRAGDLIATLHLNKTDGMSYLRFLTKDQIDTIVKHPTDWETELYIIQHPEDTNQDGKKWPTPEKATKSSRAIAIHYHINRPMGADFGESDLATAVPWLQRYSRLLEDRIRMHWAIRAFLWIVSVPSNKIDEKAEQYATPPESGSVIVKDDTEEWEAKSPVIRGADAAPDMKAVRGMVDASSGYPPHWRGEATDVNLATAQAMQEPAEKHLKRRQNYFVFILEDIIYHAYKRAHLLFPDIWPLPQETAYTKLFTAVTPDISKTDNSSFSASALNLSQAFSNLAHNNAKSTKMTRRFLSILFKFIGEPIDDEQLDEIMTEVAANIIKDEAKAKEEANPETAVPAQNGRSKDAA